jgi:hypothetical protein
VGGLDPLVPFSCPRVGCAAMVEATACVDAGVAVGEDTLVQVHQVEEPDQ